MLLIATGSTTPTATYYVLILMGIVSLGNGVGLLFNVRNYRGRIVANSLRGAEKRALGGSPLTNSAGTTHLAVKFGGVVALLAGLGLILGGVVSLI